MVPLVVDDCSALVENGLDKYHLAVCKSYIMYHRLKGAGNSYDFCNTILSNHDTPPWWKIMNRDRSEFTTRGGGVFGPRGQ